MESGTGGAAYGDGVAAELARLREALDDLRRRPIPLDADSLRHVVTASLAEASAPPPNLLVTAIRRLDRLDARLESIEGLLGGPAALPRAGAGQRGDPGRGRAPTVAAPSQTPLPVPTSYVAPPDPEALADALARRLTGILSASGPAPSGADSATVEDLLAALRPLVPGAARAVLRRAGREPSPQAVEVLQQTAMNAIEVAADGLDPFAAPASRPVEASRFASPPALAPPPPIPALAPAPPPEPVDVEALAGIIAERVAEAVVAAIPDPPPAPPAPPPVVEPVKAPPERQEPLPPPVDPAVVADAVISRLAQQPPPQAVLSPMAMAPLLSAVGNVEAAVAQLTAPEGGVVEAVDRLEAGVAALARALEEDRSAQAAEVRRGFAEVNELVRTDLAVAPRASAGGAEADGAEHPVAGEGLRSDGAAIAGIHRRLDRLTEQMTPLVESDLAAAVPVLSAQSERVDRSLGNILVALAALAENLHEQTAGWQSGFDETGAGPAGARPAGTTDLALLHQDLGGLARRVNDLVAGTAADRQRFQRLGGTIDGLAQLLGQLSERLDRLPRSLEPGARPSPIPSSGGPPGDGAEVPAEPSLPLPDGPWTADPEQSPPADQAVEPEAATGLTEADDPWWEDPDDDVFAPASRRSLGDLEDEPTFEAAAPTSDPAMQPDEAPTVEGAETAPAADGNVQAEDVADDVTIDVSAGDSAARVVEANGADGGRPGRRRGGRSRRGNRGG